MVAFQQREVVMRHVLRAPVSSEHPLASRSMPKSLELSEQPAIWFQLANVWITTFSEQFISSDAVNAPA
jgi:hypothetical protein